MRIVTNNVPRDLISGWELSEREREWFDYIAPADDFESWGNEVNRFFRYRGDVYDLREFVRIVPPGGNDQNMFTYRDFEGNLRGWEGIRTDSFFSGVVVRYCDDYERVVVGLALS